MKLKKNRLLHYASVAVVAVIISSCVDSEQTDISIENVDSVAPGFTAVYARDSASLKTIVGPINGSARIDTTIRDKQISANVLMLDQRRSDGRTNWNGRMLNAIPAPFDTDLTKELEVLSFPMVETGQFNTKTTYYKIQIRTRLNTPAIYNQLCADRWNEPLTNGKLSKSWRITPFDEDPKLSHLVDDYINFSAFENKMSYKPGSERSSDLNKIVPSDKVEVFGTFTVGEEVISEKLRSILHITNTLPTSKIEFLKVEYNNGKDTYLMKIYKVVYAVLPDVQRMKVYIETANESVNGLYLLQSVDDDTYKNYNKK